jgi:hypothetical protein
MITADEMHGNYLDFCEQMLGEGNFDTSKLSGYDDIEKIEAYSRKHPKIKVINVDDDNYAGAILVLIPHPEHGVTAIFVPQCTRIGNTFFMYPSMIMNVAKALQEMQEEFDLY